jgi:hypothetical protein
MHCCGYYAKLEVQSAVHYWRHKVVWIFQEKHALI